MLFIIVLVLEKDNVCGFIDNANDGELTVFLVDLKSATKSIRGDNLGVHGLSITIGVFARCDNAKRFKLLAYAALLGDNSPSGVGEVFLVLFFNLAVLGELTTRLFGVIGGLVTFIW